LDDDQNGGWVSVSSGTGSPGSPIKRLLLLCIAKLFTH